ncbi:hypothetical protein Phi17:1_gp28 [Cellulophaga phage phi17:1]|uniref:Uncharacterized protein n=1 Tax=Cellulophaga phage phi17:1 TaxID=1327980 RepID=R9ZYB5_9CAUD|nr:hypothetical protein Phi17:1_gp28 [Cellulophaga phage phi17:1]AGO48304.1 hypothetical protein Phi17:1_gp28 [Cellulophaga phage phi17:1]
MIFKTIDIDGVEVVIEQETKGYFIFYFNYKGVPGGSAVSLQTVLNPPKFEKMARKRIRKAKAKRMSDLRIVISHNKKHGQKYSHLLSELDAIRKEMCTK